MEIKNFDCEVLFFDERELYLLCYCIFFFYVICYYVDFILLIFFFLIFCRYGWVESVKILLKCSVEGGRVVFVDFVDICSVIKVYEFVNWIGDWEMRMDYNELGNFGILFWFYGYIDFLVWLRRIEG